MGKSSNARGSERGKDIVIWSSSSEAEEDEDDSSGDDEGDDDDYFDDYEDEDEDEDDDDYEEEEEETKGRKVNSRRNNKSRRKKEEPIGVVGQGEIHNRIVGLLKRGKDLSKLKLEECRAYLRMLKLRVAGTKAICIQRIQEHWRIKDGNGEKFYPRSSFNINCTGDVCKGDVILFKQRVYEKFDVISRGANVIGKRTIAGRVLKESYGAMKQQHTFTVEILWSKGVKMLPTLFPLLVKGRNLYRLRTFRQPWNNEAERLKVVTEKHKRGAAARHLRATVKARHTNKGLKRKMNSSDASPKKQQRKMSEMNARPLKHTKRCNRTQSYEHRARNKATTSHLLETSAMQLRHMHTHESMFNARYNLGNNFWPDNVCPHHTSRAPLVCRNAFLDPYSQPP